MFILNIFIVHLIKIIHIYVARTTIWNAGKTLLGSPWLSQKVVLCSPIFSELSYCFVKINLPLTCIPTMWSYEIWLGRKNSTLWNILKLQNFSLEWRERQRELAIKTLAWNIQNLVSTLFDLEWSELKSSALNFAGYNLRNSHLPPRLIPSCQVIKRFSSTLYHTGSWEVYSMLWQEIQWLKKMTSSSC